MRDPEAGFTLVEVLVALVVTSLLLTVILHGSSMALERLRTAEQRQAALIQGRYLLLRGSALDYGGGNGAGSAGALRWTSEETLVATDNRRLNGLMRIHVAIRAETGQLLFDHATLRMKLLPQR